MNVKKNEFVKIILSPLILIIKMREKKNANKTTLLYDNIFKPVESGNIVIKVPDHQGSFEFDFRSSILKWILLTKSYEDELLKLINQHLDSKKDVIDIGANIGLYTVLFSKIIEPSRKVLAVEPVPKAIQLLKNNLSRNGCIENVLIYEGLTCDKKANYKLNTVEGLEEYSSLGELVHVYVNNKSSKTIEVEGDTIDNLVRTNKLNPGFIKIDAEGAEFKILSGAREVMKEFRPTILCEISNKLLKAQDSSSKEVFQLLREFNYDIIDAYTLNSVKLHVEGEILAIPK